MKIGYVQTNPLWGKIDHNLQALERLVRGATMDLCVLPELFASGYLFHNRKELQSYAEDPGKGPVTQFMTDLARNLGGLVVGGFVERDQNRLYNSAALVSEKGIVRIYRKIHLFDREKFLFDVSDNGLWVEDTAYGRIGVMICFDWYFPETARTLALLGADIIAHPSNLVLPHCPEAMKTRALENRVFTVTANRIGCDQREPLTLTFIGRSRIYAPNGETLAASDETSEEFQVVEVNTTAARQKQVTDNNNLFEDRRPTLYRLR